MSDLDDLINSKYGEPDEKAYVLQDVTGISNKNAFACALHIIFASTGKTIMDARKKLNTYTQNTRKGLSYIQDAINKDDNYSEATYFGPFYFKGKVHNKLTSCLPKVNDIIISDWASYVLKDIGGDRDSLNKTWAALAENNGVRGFFSHNALYNIDLEGLEVADETPEPLPEDNRRINLTEITLQNFKGIGEKPVTIPLKPITLLFGENSAGKSTILHALLYASQVLENGNGDIDFTHAGGESVDLGGFENLVHKHDLNRKISIKMKFNVDDDGMPQGNEYFDINNYKSIKEISVTLVTSINNCHWIDDVSLLNSCTIEVEDVPVIHCEINKEDDKTESFINLSHHIFDDLEEKEEIENFCSTSVYFLEKDGKFHFVRHAPCFNGSILDFPDIEEDELSTYDVLNSLVRQFYWGSIQLLKGKIDSTVIRYIGPIRTLPPRDFSPQKSTHSVLDWSTGMAAWGLLYNMVHEYTELEQSEELTDHINAYIEDELQLGYQINLVFYKEVDVTMDRMVHKKVVDGLTPKRKLVVYDVKNKTELSLQDVGVGVSQVIPVVVGIYENSCGILAVEQPELHLHPAVQCRLADLLVLELNKGAERIFLFETHSEHLILRLLRRIRETSDGTLKENKTEKHSLTKDEVAVLYVHNVGGNTRVEELEIDEKGNFLDEWPNGFFEERFDEMFGGDECF